MAHPLLPLASHLHDEYAYETAGYFVVKTTCCRLHTRKVSLQCVYAYVYLDDLSEKMVCNTNCMITATLLCVFACEPSGYYFAFMI